MGTHLQHCVLPTVVLQELFRLLLFHGLCRDVSGDLLDVCLDVNELDRPLRLQKVSQVLFVRVEVSGIRLQLLLVSAAFDVAFYGFESLVGLKAAVSTH